MTKNINLKVDEQDFHIFRNLLVNHIKTISLNIDNFRSDLFCSDCSFYAIKKIIAFLQQYNNKKRKNNRKMKTKTKTKTKAKKLLLDQ